MPHEDGPGGGPLHGDVALRQLSRVVDGAQGSDVLDVKNGVVTSRGLDDFSPGVQQSQKSLDHLNRVPPLDVETCDKLPGKGHRVLLFFLFHDGGTLPPPGVLPQSSCGEASLTPTWHPEKIWGIYRLMHQLALGALCGTLLAAVVSEAAGLQGLQTLAALDVVALVAFLVLRKK